MKENTTIQNNSLDIVSLAVEKVKSEYQAFKGGNKEKAVSSYVANVLQDFCRKDERFAIVFPQSKSDFIREGTSLSHCVGNTEHYFTNHLSGEKMIFFVRKATDIETPFVTMEIDMRRLAILQLYGYGDKSPKGEVRKFANKFLEQLAKRENIKRRAG